VIPVLVDEKIIKPGADPTRALADLIDPSYAARAIGKSPVAGK
jgi:hypothetical protein